MKNRIVAPIDVVQSAVCWVSAIRGCKPTQMLRRWRRGQLTPVERHQLAVQLVLWRRDARKVG